MDSVGGVEEGVEENGMELELRVAAGVWGLGK